jgi:small subunit ribosomal protein S10
MPAKQVQKARKRESVEPQKLRIRVRAYDHKILDNSVRQIIDTIERIGVKFVGPVPLPTEIKKYTVSRSTFIDKDSREQFEMRVHRRVLDILNPNRKIIDSLTSLNLPAGVDIEVKTI